MTAVCPNNPNHKTFITCAHVKQYWKVDEHGNWISTVDDSVETSIGPNPDNIWTCSECGAEAIVK